MRQMVEALTVASKRGDVAGVERYERRATPRGDISLIGLREHNRLRTPAGLGGSGAAVPDVRWYGRVSHLSWRIPHREAIYEALSTPRFVSRAIACN